MKRAGSLAAAGALVAGAGVWLAAPAQAAAVGTPTYDAGSRTVNATVTRAVTETVTVLLTGPAGYKSAEGFGGIGNPTTHSFRSLPISVNGLYTLRVTSNNADSPAPRTLAVEAPPAAPGDVTAVPGGPGVVTVSWNSNNEPDRTGYELRDGGEVLARPGPSCNGRCSATLTGLSPGDHTFTVVALRACPTCSGSSISTTSAPATAAVRAPDPAPVPGDTGAPAPGEPSAPVDPGAPTTPTTPGQPDGGTGGAGPTTPAPTTSGQPVDPSAGPVPGTGGLGTGGLRGPDGVGGLDGVGGVGGGVGVPTTPRQGRASFGGFSGFGSDLAVPGLGPIDAPAPGEPVEPDGSFEPELAYDNQIREDVVSRSGGGTGTALGPITDAIDSEQLMRTLAAALVLLLTGAHLRRWLSDSTPT